MGAGASTPSHAKRHNINNTKDHVPTPGVTGGNIVVIDSATKLPTKDSGASLASIIGGINIQGSWDANTNSPDLTLAGAKVAGHGYVVTTAGNTDLNGITDWELDDVAWFDGVSSVWRKLDNSERVKSIFSRIGDIVAAASDYDASQIDNDSGVPGTFVSDALNNLEITTPIIAVVQDVKNTPEPAPIMNMYYGIAGAPTGVWSGRPGQLAQWTGSWLFTTPTEGDVIYALVAHVGTPKTRRFLTANRLNTQWDLLETYYTHADMINKHPDDHHIASTEPRQAIGYYVSNDRGTTGALGADGAENNSYKGVPEAIAKGVTNGDAHIVIQIDTRDGHNYGNLTIPTGKAVTLCSLESMLSLGAAIATITCEGGCSLSLDNLYVELIKEDTGASIELYLEECFVENIQNSTGGLPTNTTAIFSNTLTDGQGLSLASNDMASAGGQIIDINTGEIWIAGKTKTFNMQTGLIKGLDTTRIASDSDAVSKKYVDDGIATHTALPAAHHAKYTDPEAVTAMGGKGDGNPLNHDRPVQSTESLLGIAEIASQPETDAGIDDTKIVTPLKLANAPSFQQNRLGFRIAPTSNGQIDIIGWNIVTDTAHALSNATPLTISEPGYHSHIMIDASSVVGAPFNLTITGRSVDESTGVESPGDTEIISITADGWYQSTKSWVDAVILSVPAGKTLTIDVYRNTYWDRGNKDFTITGSRLEWTPDVATWSIQIEVLKANNDGSITIIDSTTFANTDGVPRAANGKPGKYKRGNYNTLVNGAQKEGLILRMTQTNIESFYVEVKYDE